MVQLLIVFSGKTLGKKTVELIKPFLRAKVKMLRFRHGQKDVAVDENVTKDGARISVNVTHASGLSRMDRFSKTDAYAKITVGETTLQTPVAEAEAGGQQHSWPGTGQLKIFPGVIPDALHIHLFDADPMGRDDLIGGYTLDIDSEAVKTFNDAANKKAKASTSKSAHPSNIQRTLLCPVGGYPLTDGSGRECGRVEFSVEIDSDPIEWIEGQRYMEPYGSTFDDFMQMTIQFGYVTLFAASFPPASLFALMNNLTEIRGDAFLLCKGHRRPYWQNEEDIGSWYGVLYFISVLGVLTNALVTGFIGSKLSTDMVGMSYGGEEFPVPIAGPFMLNGSLVHDPANNIVDGFEMGLRTSAFMHRSVTATAKSQSGSLFRLYSLPSRVKVVCELGGPG